MSSLAGEDFRRKATQSAGVGSTLSRYRSVKPALVTRRNILRNPFEQERPALPSSVNRLIVVKLTSHRLLQNVTMVK